MDKQLLLISREDISKERMRAESNFINADLNDHHYCLAAHQALALWVIAETLRELRDNYVDFTEGRR